MRPNPTNSALAARALVMLCCSVAPIFAGPPDWLQAASREALPKYAGDVPAVMLRNDQIATIKNNGEVTTLYRRAYKILRPEGRSYGTVAIYFDSETRISSLKAWSIPASGNPYELSEKDSVDTILFTGNLYEDDRQKVLRLPAAAAAGTVIGYEYEQRQRPSIFQQKWMFQQEVPVRQARLQVNLPSGWEYREVWANHAAVPLQPGSATQMIWELKDIAPIAEERAMPPWQATAGQLLLTYIRPGAGNNMNSWRDVGVWYAQLVADRRQATPELRQKVAELTAQAPTVSAKIQALASFVQREIRYVAIEIGIGGYQPHAAQDIFRNRYGDCKDKATLLSAMLREIGVESYYVLINTHRGVIRPEFASPLGFNHAILAIRPPADSAGGLRGIVQHPQLGTLLFFDPTSAYVPYGDLPVELQANNGLVVSDSGGELVKLPLAPAEANSVQRILKLQLATDGSLQGESREIRTGAAAADFRGGWLNASQGERQKGVQSMFGQLNAAAELKNVSVTNLDRPEADPVLNYQVRLPGYAKPAGSLVLLRPALSVWADDVMEHGERSQPLTFPGAVQRSEILEIALPEGYTVDELPPPVETDIGIASYTSRTESDGGILRYTRRLVINDVLANTDRLAEIKKFYRQVNAGERTTIVLKKR